MNVKKNITGTNTNNMPPARAGIAGDFEETANDPEIFIRKVFSEDPSTGCKLLFKRYFQPLCSHAVRFVYSRQVAEDLVSDVFYKFWDKKAFDSIRCSYRAYLFTSVRNACINYLKWEFVRSPGDVIPFTDILSDGGDFRLNIQADELNKIIEKTIQALPRKCQAVFLKSRLEGKKNAEIASELNVSTKAIEAHITRALDSLRSVLKKEYL